eukprot:655309-Amphidinium_carterae.2
MSIAHAQGCQYPCLSPRRHQQCFSLRRALDVTAARFLPRSSMPRSVLPHPCMNGRSARPPLLFGFLLGRSPSGRDMALQLWDALRFRTDLLRKRELTRVTTKSATPRLAAPMHVHAVC